MARRESVQQFGTDFAKALAGVMFKMKQKRFEEELDNAMQPKEEQQNVPVNQSTPGNLMYRPEVQQAGGYTQTVQKTPDILRVLAQLSQKYPEQTAPLIQSQYNVAQAAKAPWMDRPQYGAENVLTGETREPVFKPETQTQKNASEIPIGEPYKSKDGLYWMQKYTSADPITNTPLKDGQTFERPLTQVPQARPSNPATEKRLIKSYQIHLTVTPQSRRIKIKGCH